MRDAVIVGLTIKFEVERAEAPGTFTRTLPLSAPVGTEALIFVLFSTLKLVEKTPPKDTPVAPRKLVPLIRTFVPVRPAAGEKPVKVGLPKKLEVVTELPREV